MLIPYLHQSSSETLGCRLFQTNIKIYPFSQKNKYWAPNQKHYISADPDSYSYRDCMIHLWSQSPQTLKQRNIWETRLSKAQCMYKGECIRSFGSFLFLLFLGEMPKITSARVITTSWEQTQANQSKKTQTKKQKQTQTRKPQLNPKASTPIYAITTTK